MNFRIAFSTIQLIQVKFIKTTIYEIVNMKKSHNCENGNITFFEKTISYKNLRIDKIKKRLTSTQCFPNLINS